jgi:aspartate-semialdehyde dehydrogenase
MAKRLCAILGASGIVSQRLQQRLVNHPWFELVAICGGPDTAGKPLRSIDWRLEQERPDIADMVVLDLSNSNICKQLLDLGVSIVFSAIPSEIAQSVEPMLAESGFAVFSNASTYRRVDGIPLIIAEINPSHMEHFAVDGLPLVCSTNCTLIPLAMPLAALSKLLGIKSVTMRSEQSLSGAGWRLLFDEKALAGSVDPEIPDEARKTASELRYVLGETMDGPSRKNPKSSVHIANASIDTDIVCQRISRKDGHQVFVTVKLLNPTTLAEVKLLMSSFHAIPQLLNLPSAPTNPIQLVDKIDTNKHLWADGDSFPKDVEPSKDLRAGMAITVGNLELIEPDVLSFEAFSHNTIRGAAGGVVLLAEFALNEGYLD